MLNTYRMPGAMAVMPQLSQHLIKVNKANMQGPNIHKDFKQSLKQFFSSSAKKSDEPNEWGKTTTFQMF